MAVPTGARSPGSRGRQIATYLVILVAGVLAVVVVLPLGNRTEAAPHLAPLSAVTGPGADCLGPELAAVQSGTFLDLHEPGPAGAEDVESELGGRVGRGRVDRELGDVTLTGRCAGGTPLAGEAYDADLVLHRPAAAGGADGDEAGDDGAATVTGTVVVGGQRLDVAMAPTEPEGDAGAEQLRGGELTGRIFLAVAVVIVAARLLGHVFNRMRQPRVMGEIVAGILLGPSLVGLVWPDFTSYLFPSEVTGVLQVMAQFGLIFFMFLIGLELDLRLVRGSGHAAVLISHVSIVLPFTLGLVASVVLHPLLGSGEFTGFALFMGAAMAITAFPVLARILTDTGLYRTRLGALSISCAAVDDVTAWCILAGVVAVVQSAGPLDAVRTVVLSAVFVAVLILVVRPLAGRLAAVHEDRGRLNPPVMATLLVAVFLAAWTTEEIGIHAIFGAFMLGVVMPRSSGLVEEITGKLEDVTVLFLLPIFFAVVGLSTRFGLLDQLSLWAVAALVVGLAVLGKLGGTLIAARAAGQGWRSSAGLGLLMNTRGLTEIVILTIGRSLGVISPALFTIMVIMALVTTFMATPLLAVVYPRRLVERDARRAARGLPATGPRGGHRVLVAVGTAEQSRAMLDVVSRLRGPQRERPSVVLAQVVPPPGREEVRANLGDLEAAAAEARERLVPLAAELLRAGVDTTVRTRVSPDPGAELARIAAEEGADLVVAGWHRPYLGRNPLGGVVGDVLAQARCDVAVLLEHPAADDPVPPGPAPASGGGTGALWGQGGPGGPVAVWFTGGFHDGAALDLGVRLARDGAGSLRLLHPTGTEVPHLGVDYEEIALASTEPRALLAGLRGASLVVIGRDDRGDGASGSRREAVLEDGTVPVLLVQRGEAATDPPH